MSRIITCKECGEEKPHGGHGFCGGCRNRAYYAANREKIKAQHRAWYKANSEKIKAQHRAWRKANPEEVRAYYRARRKANSEKIKAQHRAWRKANPEKVRAYYRAWYKANPEKIKARKRAWRKANPEKVRARKRIYNKVRLQKARCLKGALPSSKCVKHLAGNWTGGRDVFCAVCGEYAGWRSPCEIKGNKTGFRCKKHWHVSMKGKTDEQEHEGNASRSRVA